MPRLVYLTSATRELAKLASDLEDAGQSRGAALAFIDKLTDYCEHLARLPGLLGRARPELRPEYRSATFASYVIFFRYVDGSAPRQFMEIIHFLHGARDIEAFFLRGYDGGY
jgi:toxin ParE1/3/4